MSGQLEQFIRDHRDEFDTDEPANKIWDTIQQQLEPESGSKSRTVSFWLSRWAVAASVVIVLGTGGWYFFTGRSGKATQLPGTVAQNGHAGQQPVKASNQLPKPDSSSVPKQTIESQREVVVKSARPNTRHKDGVDPYVSKEMVYYAKIVELKHEELGKIQKDEPLLYKQFSSDVYKLDSVYHSLQRQLPKNPNREQLLEAMIQNLQLQMELLNHQLKIIQQINNSKKSAYEQAYKSA